MSGLQTSSSITGTAVDPTGPAGVIIDPYTEIAGSPGLDDVIKGDGLGGWTIGVSPSTAAGRRHVLEFGTTLGVPNAGTRYLDRGGITVTSVPVLLHAAATLIGITISVDAVDGSRTFDAEVVSDPAGTPVLVGSGLTLTTGSRTASRRDLSATIGAGTLWGARVRRTVGAGPSSFKDIRVEVEVLMP